MLSVRTETPEGGVVVRVGAQFIRVRANGPDVAKGGADIQSAKLRVVIRRALRKLEQRPLAQTAPDRPTVQLR